jgi:O-antigen ligase
VKSTKNSIIKIIIYTAVLISLIFTPMNYDALIIPKVILLFCLVLYLFPKVLTSYKEILANRKLKFLVIVSLLMILQMLIVIIISEAPIEQQIFGRTGRGLGFITYSSLILLLIFTAIYMKIENLKFVLYGIIISCSISSVYSALQKYDLDIFNWNSKTNGIIGTLGNPNFQSSFAAMVFIPAVIYAWSMRFRYILVLVSGLFFSFMIYITQSTQGYVAVAASILVYLLIYLWFKNKNLFYGFTLLSVLSSAFAIAGMLNQGPLSQYLYKISVQSRGDFWRSAISAANANPVFGVGLDSTSDVYLKYRDQTAANHPWGEMTDNAHNYFLELAATGGYPLAFLYLIIIILSLYSFFSLQKKLGKFDANLASLFSAWVVFQLQSIISPGNIVLMIWNSILCGVLIGTNAKYFGDQSNSQQKVLLPKFKINTTSILLPLIGFILMFPYFNSDRLLLKGLNTGNADLVIQAVKSYPESVSKYNLIGQELLRSNLPIQALDVARSAIKFNQNAPSAWGLLLVNPSAPAEERQKAREQILRLDPLNTEVLAFKF